MLVTSADVNDAKQSKIGAKGNKKSYSKQHVRHQYFNKKVNEAKQKPNVASVLNNLSL